jgi:starch-binding outer membrane protein, SusD/RagB family
LIQILILELTPSQRFIQLVYRSRFNAGVMSQPKKTARNLILVIISLIPLSCGDDFLNRPLQGELTQESFPKSGEDALLSTNAIYNILRNSSFHFGLFPIMDIMSDDAYKGSNPSDQAATIGPFDRFQHIATESNLLRWWNTLYNGVRRANVVIEKVPLIVTMDQSLQKRYVGEAKFLRALFYFDLLRAWGGVPIVTQSTAATGLTRASAEQVNELIINDLLDAVSNLPEKSEYAPIDLGRATKGAARALLARVYLFKGDFVNAEKYSLEVINSAQYDLEILFTDANSEAGEHGVESIFEIGAMRFENIENGGDQYGNVQGVRGTPNRGWGFNRPSLELIAAFESGDPRREGTILYLGEEIDGITILGDGTTPDETRDAQNNLIEIECYNQKVWTPGATVPPQFGHNRRIIRYADVLLMAAEALNENNKSALALTHLNKVRKRARGTSVLLLPDVTDTNKATLRTKIWNEQRVELALEGHRFWDLIRTGRANSILGPLGFKVGKDELLPIPQNEIDLAKGSLKQNPGWE